MTRKRLLWLYDQAISEGYSHDRAQVRAASQLVRLLAVIPFGGDKDATYRHHRGQLRAALTIRSKKS